jgi:hypothetical protein
LPELFVPKRPDTGASCIGPVDRQLLKLSASIDLNTARILAGCERGGVSEGTVDMAPACVGWEQLV